MRSRLSQAKLKLAEQWQQHTDADNKFFRQSEAWNSFYHQTLSGIHRHDNYKNEFINHLQKNVQIITPAGKAHCDNKFFEKMIIEDRRFGSWLAPAHVISSGDISIVEANHFNSPEYPDHCPTGSVMVLYRNKQKVEKMKMKIFQ